jgi:hypothetical protein
MIYKYCMYMKNYKHGDGAKHFTSVNYCHLLISTSFLM